MTERHRRRRSRYLLVLPRLPRHRPTRMGKK
uniref:Uncharacterized protein n=1 Tax=Rhizophora mucronata TaxID=61149 RepID=A0A2P2JAW3_RHIMU